MFSLGKTLSDRHPMQRQQGAKYALRMLAAINLLNFADRYIPAAVKSQIKEELHLTDFETALPNTGMIVVFMISAVIFGQAADKQYFDRRSVLAFGVVFWSIATGLAGLSQNLWQLILFRSLVGVGEAAYGSIAPPMLFDFFPVFDRNISFGVYYLAIPFGGALGFAIGGVLGSALGWRWAFVAVGIPGIIVALLILKLNNPVRGINDPQEIEEDQESSKLMSSAVDNDEDAKKEGAGAETDSDGRRGTGTFWEDAWEISSNPVFALSVLGLAANNFALGGLADWITVYLERYNNASLEEAGMIVGAGTVIGGIGGTYLGSIFTQYYDGKVKSAYFLVSALFTLPAAALLVFAVNVRNSKAAVYTLIFSFELFVWTCTAPINALSINCIRSPLRARAAGLCIFLQHILGDIISPPLIGYLSDQYNLEFALQVTWMAVLFSGASWFAGYLFLPPLPNMTHDDDDSNGSNITSEQQGRSGDEGDITAPLVKKQVPITFGAILLPCSEASRLTDDEPWDEDEGEVDGASSVSASDTADHDETFAGFANTSVLSPTKRRQPSHERGFFDHGESGVRARANSHSSRSNSYEFYVPPNLNPLLHTNADGGGTGSRGNSPGVEPRQAAGSVGSSVNEL